MEYSIVAGMDIRIDAGSRMHAGSDKNKRKLSLSQLATLA
jgi:hypothetical protein